MTLGLFLHLYQPPTQFPEVLKEIVESSYRPLLDLLKEHPDARVTLNVSASLTEQLANRDLSDVVTKLVLLARRGQVELVGSAAYHPLLTEIPAAEIRRQIRINDAINRRYFGDAYRPCGFFPPEMAVNQNVVKVIADEGFEWVIVDESGVKAQNSERETQKSFRSDGLKIVVRDSDLSVKVAFSEIRTVGKLIVAAQRRQDQGYPLVLAMDGETFGHHRPEQLQFLAELFAAVGNGHVRLQTVSQVPTTLGVGTITSIEKSAWGPWERWRDPKNPIHQLQWELTELAIETVKSSKCKVQNLERSTPALPDNSRFKVEETFNSGRGVDSATNDVKEKQWLKARHMLDKSLHSDQYWWASAKPCWHFRMVERGARMLRETVLAVPDSSEDDRERARRLYQGIIETGLKLYGDCVIK